MGVIITNKTEFLGWNSRLYRKSPVEFIVMYICLFIFLFGLLGSVFNIEVAQSTIVNSVSFFSSVIFSWILTNYSNQKAFEEKQEEGAIRSYRHSIKVKNNIDYSIEVSNIINNDLLNTTCSASEHCPMTDSILRLRDALITAQINSTGSINDWSDIFSEQILNIDDIKVAEKEIRRLTAEKQGYSEFNMSDKVFIDNINDKIKEQKEIIEKKSDGINSNLMLMIKLDEQFRDEALEHIRKEEEYKRAMRIQRKIKTRSFQSRSQYQSRSKYNNANPQEAEEYGKADV